MPAGIRHNYQQQHEQQQHELRQFTDRRQKVCDGKWGALTAVDLRQVYWPTSSSLLQHEPTTTLTYVKVGSCPC